MELCSRDQSRTARDDRRRRGGDLQNFL